eukprot:scaffold265340_cov30-Tisochrysis_lutea.AAC.4
MRASSLSCGSRHLLGRDERGWHLEDLADEADKVCAQRLETRTVDGDVVASVPIGVGRHSFGSGGT